VVRARYARNVSDASALVDEIANKLDTWPGVNIERETQTVVLVRYERLELGVLDTERAVAEVRFSPSERDELVEHGEAEPVSASHHGENVSHDIGGPSDVTAVLELFGRRYRDLRGEDDPYSSKDAPGESRT
jgi:luciferase-like monooxygenase